MSEAAHVEGTSADTQRTLTVLWISGFASNFAYRCFDPMVAVVARDMHADPHTIALLASAFALPYAFIQPILGPIGDSLGKARVMRACLLALVIALCVSALVPNPTALFVARVASGAAAGGLIPLSLATIGDRVEMSGRQVAIGRFLVFAISGQLVGGMVAGLLADTVGWRGVTVIAAGIALLAFVSFAFGLRGSSSPRNPFTVGIALDRYRRILAIGRARALYSFVFIEGIIIFGIQPHLAPILEARGLGGAFQAGLIVAGFGIGGVTYTLTVGPLIRTLGLKRMLIVGGLLIGAAYGVESAAPAWTVQAALFFALGYGFYTMHNTYQTQVTEVVSEARGSAVALHSFAFFCGQALGPVVIGTGLDSVGYPLTILGCAAGAVLLGFVSASILFGPQRAR